jgi:imidazoleglycerol-phosphate dehydratase
MKKAKRISSIERKTKETFFSVSFCLDGEGRGEVDTKIPFVNHMFELFAKHGFFDLKITGQGDTDVDFHHSIEDLGIILGSAIKEALGDKKGINRFGYCILPMDEALAMVSIDLSGRAFLSYEVAAPTDNISGIDVRLFHEFFYALAVNAGMTLHIKLLSGKETHHILEAVFKAFAKALSNAAAKNPKEKGIPSTKGEEKWS